MTLELDIAHLVTAFIERKLDSLLRLSASGARKATASVRASLEQTYRPYLRELLRRTTETKTFVVRDRPLPLSQIYVPVDLAAAGIIYSAVKIEQLANISQPSFIFGEAGTGKSLLMRHLVLDAISSSTLVPILIELRRLNDSDLSLRDLIRQTTQDLGLKIADDEFSSILGSGRLLLLLDAFDEVRYDKRSTVTYQILELTSSTYGRAIVIVSSRPEATIEGWPNFRILRICPLSLDKATDLINRLPIDPEVKSAFTEELTASLYENRKSFSVNPLLLSIMLLTFSQNAYIPLKRNLFFDKAYDVLFEQHDALKPAFKRERKSRLDIEEFARLFSAFALVSYDEERTRFPESYARQLTEHARSITGVKVITDDFVHDAIQAVSLLVRDGLEIAYTHRSFQEYFTAKFIVEHASGKLREDLLEKYSRRIQTDEVVDLAFEMNPRLVERDYLAGKMAPLLAFFRLDRRVCRERLKDFFSFVGLQFQAVVKPSGFQGRPQGVHVEVSYSIERGEVFSLCELIIRLYQPQQIHISREDWRGVILKVWKKEASDRSINWSFDSSFSQELLAGLAANGGVFSLARLEVVAKAISMMEDSLRRELSVRELLQLDGLS